ncbi:MAG: hypothetical protein MZV70_21465 [Desulfobacterales bacterium]|nr:hypothetical protein [Desulfobacterales bacterium]
MSDRIAVMSKGVALQIGLPAETHEAPGPPNSLPISSARRISWMALSRGSTAPP